MSQLVKTVVALAPVLLFLLALVFLDSYKLIRKRTVIRAIAAGAAAALVCLVVNRWLLEGLDLSTGTFARYVAPVVEELAKSVYLIYVIRKRQCGFLVDSAIVGFGIGAGFAFIENIHFLYELTEANLVLWIIRGFGTAILHGGTMTLFGIISRHFADRAGREHPGVFLPGLLLSIVIHSVFNHFILPPAAMTAVLLAVFPVLIVVAFQRSENATRRWLGVGLDSDMELLEIIMTEKITTSRIGGYFESLRDHFRPEVLADMLCYLRVYLELSMQAKGLMMMRESGFDTPVNVETRAQLDELKHLEGNIGRTGLFALHPVLKLNSRDLWQLYMLGQQKP